ncbi:exodeoxyribonuclease V subunit alpha [Buchnera aphidicola (Macrosiphoniella sanborni)]|uniref:RecBCD enzyme subunit RecD n=1 Tax=Buchnera aphidicola (Macrosiphoniella sanborni) TaxID=1241865 RepID=A0A4D6YDC8_9GAMM|nr:exodeoxyribonuclease V subunit alpha [Buchnera aphidicola]QCI23968.1 exodeoxyribonuclease V subunit alpha [Buchnera aphidicola (Macrosiphoniella sanborni)]
MLILLKDAVNKNIIRPIDLYFAEFIEKKNNIIILVAACISYESNQGHISLPIKYFQKNLFFSSSNKKFIKNILIILKKKINWEDELLKHPSISYGLIPTPLVLYKKKIYLYKMWKAENNIFNYLLKNNITNKINRKKLSIILNNLFPSKRIDFQKIAVANTLINNITFIFGGPGTGKTTTILKIIIALIKNSKKILKIQLSAPTGNATTHLSEIINNNIFDIYLSQKEKKSLLFSPKTIHKLLAIHEISQKSFFNQNNQLDLDVLIIDEISMVDIFLMEKILCAVSKNTKLIFIGDYNQLRPIESGSILRHIILNICNNSNRKNIINIEKITGYKLCRNITKKIEMLISCNICILKKNYRFKKKSGIHLLSNAIINKNMHIIQKVFNNTIDNVRFYNINSIQEYQNMIEKISFQYIYFWKKIHKKNKIKEIIQAFQNHQTLCILNHGIFGINILNKKIEENMHNKKIIKYLYINEEPWYIGKPILITKNNQYLNIFNGNIGITNINKYGILQVSFLKENDTIHSIPVKILKNYKTAWAITIHKSQGSEFINTTLIVPNIYSSFLNQDIIYTGVTRTKKNLNIFGNKDVFIKSILNKINEI